MNTVVKKYLEENGYKSIKDWAKDSDYRMVSRFWDGDYWVDEQGYRVNIDEQLLAVIEGLGNA